MCGQAVKWGSSAQSLLYHHISLYISLESSIIESRQKAMKTTDGTSFFHHGGGGGSVCVQCGGGCVCALKLSLVWILWNGCILWELTFV